MHKKEIDYQSLGFGNLVELMAKLPDFVLIEPPNANGDFLLKLRKIPGYYFISFVSVNCFSVNNFLTNTNK